MKNPYVRSGLAATIAFAFVIGFGTRSSAQNGAPERFFQRTISLGVPTANYDAIEPVDIPKGRVLVVDHVSVRTEAAVGETWSVEVGVAPGNFTHYLVLQPGLRSSSHGNLRDFFTASQPMRFYVQSGESLLIRVTHNGADGVTPDPNAGVITRVSGHFENSGGV